MNLGCHFVSELSFGTVSTIIEINYALLLPFVGELL